MTSVARRSPTGRAYQPIVSRAKTKEIVGALSVARLLVQTLKENAAADEALAEIAATSVNKAAAVEWSGERANGPWSITRPRSARRTPRDRAKPRL